MHLSDWSSDVCSSDLAARVAGWEKIMADERMKNDPNNQPFDGKRMIYADSRRSSTPDIPPFSRGRASNVAPNSRTPAPSRRATMTNPKEIGSTSGRERGSQ